MKNRTPPATLSVPAAVQLLSAELGETSEVWTSRLVSWRRPERQGQSPFHHIHIQGHRPVYLESDVRRYIARMKLEKGAIQSDPLDNLPNALAHVIRNQQARLIVQVSWNDVNTSGVLALSIAAAEDLAKSLNSAIAELKDKFSEDFNQDMEQDMKNLSCRMGVSESGEIATLEDALKQTITKTTGKMHK